MTRRWRPRGDDSMFDPTKIDVVSISPEGDCAELVIVVDNPWTGTDRQLLSLQEKIHNYVAFAVDGQMSATYPETDGLPWRITVMSRVGPPDERTAELIRLTADRVRGYRGDLVLRTSTE